MSAELKIEGMKASQKIVVESEKKLPGGVRRWKARKAAPPSRADKIVEASRQYHQQEARKIAQARRSSTVEISSQPDFWQIPVETLEQTLAPSFHKIVEDAHQKGFSTCHADEMGVYRLHPDGRKEYIEDTYSRK